MRMRKLGQGQSLMFMAPPEVHQDILKVTSRTEVELDGFDVVLWVLHNTCQHIERSRLLNAAQGLSYCQRRRVMEAFLTSCRDLEDLGEIFDPSAGVVRAFVEEDDQQLSTLYAPRSTEYTSLLSIAATSLKKPNPIESELIEILKAVEGTKLEGTTLNEERERQVSHEAESETQVVRPPKLKAYVPSVDPNLNEFIRTGSDDYHHCFPRVYDQIIKWTSAKDPAAEKLFPDIRVSKDFARTIISPKFGVHDNYLRPVNFILTNKEDQPSVLIVISPFEANQLLPEIRLPSSGVDLHNYEPRVSKSMRSLDTPTEPLSALQDLWRALAPISRRELHLFAGQVYPNSRKEYEEPRRHLSGRRNASEAATMNFVRNWIVIPCKGHSISQAPLWKMIKGEEVKDDAFAWRVLGSESGSGTA